jgi:hypothetical protein
MPELRQGLANALANARGYEATPASPPEARGRPAPCPAPLGLLGLLRVGLLRVGACVPSRLALDRFRAFLLLHATNIQRNAFYVNPHPPVESAPVGIDIG